MFVPISQNKRCVLCEELKPLKDFETNYGNGILGVWTACEHCRRIEIKLAMSEKKSDRGGGYYPGYPVVHV